jgi:dCTP deaminase
VSLLSDGDITVELAAGRLVIWPQAEGALQPASVDVHLGPHFAFFAEEGVIDPREPQAMSTLDATGQNCLLPAGGFALASTAEVITLPDDIAGRYEGKSSIARLGLASHVTGAFLDPGFSGQVTLELANLSGRPILLRPGMAIGQVAFTYLHSPCRVPYGPERGNHYQDQRGPTSSAAYLQAGVS